MLLKARSYQDVTEKLLNVVQARKSPD
uniref:Uncharacterized protein n=1 Tax=Anguilla anguilla TaxID=7936 RepID=A0A0E9QL25_ANGAN